MPGDAEASSGGLRRVIGFPALLLFGVGTMVGGGFYALLGEVVAEAGMLAPLALLAAGLLALLNGLSFGELSSRYPVSAGEVHYVRAGLGRVALARLTGWMVIATGVVSSATLAVATAGFLADLAPVPMDTGVVAVVLALGALAAWGVGQSVLAVALITVVEVGTLLVIVAVRSPDLGALPALWDGSAPVDPAAAAAAVFSAAFLAFYAFIGFEDMVNMAEEVERPRRVLPRALVASVVITTLLYLAASAVALVVPRERLVASRTPVAELVGAEAGAAIVAVRVVSLLTGVNGALVQILMASRVAYGMARQGLAPSWLGRVAARTGTPVAATAAAVAVILGLALFTPLATLAQTTSAIILGVFALVNLSLWRIHGRERGRERERSGAGGPGGHAEVGLAGQERAGPEGRQRAGPGARERPDPAPAEPGARCPRWVPVAGFLSCVAVLGLRAWMLLTGGA